MILIIVLLSILFPLSAQNVVKLYTGDFEEIVLNSEDTWLISVESSMDEVENVERRYRGLFRVGWTSKADILKDHKVNSSKDTLYLVYPYGSEKQKQQKVKLTKSIENAVELALKSIPDSTVILPNRIEGQNVKLRGFFEQAYASTPTRFPMVYFTESTETPAEVKVLALKYSTLFSFGIIRNPSAETMATYNIKTLPHFTAFIVDSLVKETQPRIKKIQFIEKLYGPLKFSMMVRFLYLLHKYHFTELPYSSVHKVDIDLDSIFLDDLDKFSENYLKHPLNVPSDKKEL